MKWIFMVGLLASYATSASAQSCYYFRDLPKELRQYRDALDEELYEKQGTMVIPKKVAGCEVDICTAWIKCDNGRGRPVVKAKAACKATAGKCPTAEACIADNDVIIDDGFKVVSSGSRNTRGADVNEGESQEGVE